MNFSKPRSISKLIIISFLALVCGTLSISAQPAPPPGPPPGQMAPPPNAPAPPPPSAPNPVPPPPGAPVTPAPGPPAPPPPAGWAYSGFLSNPPVSGFNQGTINVMATGYDNESVLVQIPLVVSYSFNGATYDVTVLNSWNPMTQTWNMGVDTPAYNTSYYFNGFTYNFYAMLPSGTYYFNL